ncbi:hypothetical protein F4780DRAFT_749400 [Xylariomycetidae sp. FL0641]|nr:hypothetical protein F4780DRAFT_749400 [Xylariomycetidae sp. FL0641]
MSSIPTDSLTASPVLAASVTRTALLGVMWSGTAFSIIVVIARLIIRRKLFRQFKTDDFLVISALVFYLASTLTWTILINNLYITLNSNPVDPIALLNTFGPALHGNLASYICSWSCLWSIKLSFMSFFHGLGRQVRSQRILWWCVLVFIIASYIVCIGLLDYGCLTANGIEILKKCASQWTIDYEYANTRVFTTLDIVTDMSIVAVSANIVYRAHIPWNKKAVLAFVCSLTAVMVVVAIIRITVGAPNKVPDLSWLLLWNSVEMTLAIFVACIASFRSLYIQAKTSRQEEIPPSYELKRPSARRILASTFGTDTLLSTGNAEWTQQPSHESVDGLWTGPQVTTKSAVSSNFDVRSAA